MQVFLRRDFEKPLRIADYSFTEKTAVGKNGESVAKGGRILNDPLCLRGHGGDQTVQKMNRVLLVRQRGQLSLDSRNLDLCVEIQH